MIVAPLITRAAARLARRRLRRAAGTGATAWAVCVPLVTLALTAALLLAVARDGGPRRG